MDIDFRVKGVTRLGAVHQLAGNFHTEFDVRTAPVPGTPFKTIVALTIAYFPLIAGFGDGVGNAGRYNSMGKSRFLTS